MPDYPYIGDVKQPTLEQKITYHMLNLYAMRGDIPVSDKLAYLNKLYLEGVDPLPIYSYNIQETMLHICMTGEFL